MAQVSTHARYCFEDHLVEEFMFCCPLKRQTTVSVVPLRIKTQKNRMHRPLRICSDWNRTPPFNPRLIEDQRRLLLENLWNDRNPRKMITLHEDNKLVDAQPFTEESKEDETLYKEMSNLKRNSRTKIPNSRAIEKALLENELTKRYLLSLLRER